MGRARDLSKEKFGRLQPMYPMPERKNGSIIWHCECDCGNPNHIFVLGGNLRKGHTTSCGCERMSHGEQAVSKILRENNIPFESEKILFKFANGHNAKFDFYVNKKYIIEYDGETHYQYNLHGWHNEEQLKAQQERDIIKNQWCKDNNILLIRIPYTHLEDLKLEDLLLETSQFVVN